LIFKLPLYKLDPSNHFNTDTALGVALPNIVVISAAVFVCKYVLKVALVFNEKEVLPSALVNTLDNDFNAGVAVTVKVKVNGLPVYSSCHAFKVNKQLPLPLVVVMSLIVQAFGCQLTPAAAANLELNLLCICNSVGDVDVVAIPEKVFRLVSVITVSRAIALVEVTCDVSEKLIGVITPIAIAGVPIMPSVFNNLFFFICVFLRKFVLTVCILYCLFL
jgi:hypothetical protein